MLKKILIAAFCLSAVAFAQQTDQTPQTMLANIIQPTHSIRGDTIAAHWTGGVFTMPSHTWAKGAELKLSSTDGYLAVHLVPGGGTYESYWYLMPLKAGERSGAMFDKIDSARTTVAIDSVVIFPKD